MSIDPTFDFGKFAVTPITTHHLMLKSQQTGNHPIMLGPVMIHHRKTYETYYTLASRVAAANPKLKDVKGIVTDGEEPLQNSFSHVFSNAQPLRDFRHFRQNMENALNDLGISAKKDRTPFLNNVLGYVEKTRCTSRDYVTLTTRLNFVLCWTPSGPFGRIERLVSQKTLYFPGGQKTLQSEGTTNEVTSADTEENGMSSV